MFFFLKKIFMIFTDTITMDMHDGTINQYETWGHRFIKHILYPLVNVYRKLWNITML